jgi:hypothetical protein
MTTLRGRGATFTWKALAWLAWLLPAPATAQSAQPVAPSRPERDLPPPARHRLYYSNLFAVRYNGIFEELRLSYRYRLMDSSHLLLRDTFLGLGVAPGLSPAFGRIGAFAELQPITPLTLTAQYDAIRYFGTFRLLQSFPNAGSEFSDSELRRLADEDKNYASPGQLFTLGVLVQGKMANVVVRSNSRFVYADMNLRTGDTVFYDIVYDLLAPNQGWIVSSDNDLLYVTKFGSSGAAFTTGLRYTVAHAFYNDTQLAAGQENLNSPTHRLGPFFGYTFFSRPSENSGGGPTTHISNATVVLLTQWWLHHRYRTGQDTSQAVPYLAIALSVNGDLWSSGKP